MNEAMARMNENTIFTDYVRVLRLSIEPPPDVFEAAWSKLRRLLVGELKRRGLWNAPPSYLGIYGYSRWSDEDAFEELRLDCYEALFVDRMPSLEALTAEPSAKIDALCLQNLRYFLHERQKKHDPLGYRVFAVLRRAVRDLIEEGVLHVLEGDPRVRNATVLGFAPEAELESRDEQEDRGLDLDGYVEAWLDDVLPDLATAAPSKLEDVNRKLGGRLSSLAETGITAFRFEDVAGPLKKGVQSWRDAIWQTQSGVEDDDGDFVSILRQVRPGAEYEERQFFDKVVECVSAALPGTMKTKKTGDQLEKYWNFLRSQVAGDREDEMPSRRKICSLLDIQRYRIPEFHEILKREVERCRAAFRLPVDRGGAR